MDNESNIIIDVLCEQAPQVESFVKCLTYWRSLSSCNNSFDGDFIEEAYYAFLGTAVISWCNVFVDCKSDVYWSKLIRNMTKDIKYDFENRIYKSTGLDEKRYQHCRDYVKTIRDKYFAHRDLDWQNHIWNSPDFKNAVKIAKEYERWLNDLLNKESPFFTCSLNDVIKSTKVEIDHVTELLST